MAMPMLAVECKLTDATDYIKPLSKYIKSSFDKDTLARHEEHLEALQQLREDVRLGTEKTEASLSRLRHYLSSLLSLQRHFPVSENDFNCGAVASQIALLQNRSSDDGLKVACKYFQIAAGTFKALREDLQNQNAQTRGTSDLTEDVLFMLENVMLAQAQECFFDKVARSGLASVAVSQVASGVADFYDTALALADSKDVKRESVPPKWDTHLLIRMALYSAICEFHAAEDAKSRRKFGDQVAYLSRSVRFLETITPRQLKSASADVVQSFQMESERIRSAFSEAQRDNNSIYHELVPSSLGCIEKKVMVKAAPFEVESLSPAEDPFKELVPVAVRQGVEQYNQRAEERVRGLLSQLEEANAVLTMSLQSMNLPGAILALDNPSGIPSDLESKISAFQSQGGVSHLSELKATLGKLAQESGVILTEALKVLDDEEDEDGQMRSNFGQRWTRTPSHTLTTSLRQEASKYRLNVEHAVKSDAYIQRKFDDNARMLTTLSGSRESIAAMLPQAAVKPGSEASVARVKQCLSATDQIGLERNALMDRIKEMRNSDDISGALLTSTLPVEMVIEEGLQKYNALEGDIQASVSAQEAALGELISANEEFVRSRGTQIGNNDRDRVLSQIVGALSVHTELMGNFTEGIRFYTNFQELLTKFKQRCLDFTVARRTEKLELLNQLTATTAGMGGGSGMGGGGYGQAPPSYAHHQQHQQHQQHQYQQYSSYAPPPSGTMHQPPSGGGAGFTPLLQPGSSYAPQSNYQPGGSGFNPGAGGQGGASYR